MSLSWLAVIHFPYHDVALKVSLSAGIGLLVGLEREWAHKEIGVRTFALAGLLGMLTSLVSPVYVVAALAGILLLATLLNVHSLLKDRSLELTTALSLMLRGKSRPEFCGFRRPCRCGGC